MTPEGKVKAKLKDWLRCNEAYYFMPVQTGYGSTTLDFLVCQHGAFIGYECKAPGKKLTTRQELTAMQITMAGGATYKVTLNANNDLVFEPCGLIDNED